MIKSLIEQRRFMAAWLRNPVKIGAIAPSSKGLSKAMLTGLGYIPEDTAIIELGPGTGAVTEQLLTRLQPQQIISIERDAELAQQLNDRWPQLQVINASAEALALHIPKDIAIAGIISSLPLLNFPTALRLAIVKACFSVCTIEAAFIQFSYGASSPITQDICKDLNLRTERLQKIWLNAPPATVWRYTRDTTTHPTDEAQVSKGFRQPGDHSSNPVIRSK